VHGGRSRRFMVSYRIPGLGQRTKTLHTLSEAKEFQGSVRDPARREQLRKLEKGRVLLSDYFGEWLVRKRRLTASTRLRYEGVGRRYIVPGRLGGLAVSRISRDDVERWVADLLRDGV